MTLGLLRDTATDRHELAKIIAIGWLCERWDDFPLEDEEMPLDWIEDLAAELEAAIEDRAREWLATKRVSLGEAKPAAKELGP